MTVRERVLISRLILEIEDHDSYAEQIGLSYKMEEVKYQKDDGENR